MNTMAYDGALVCVQQEPLGNFYTIERQNHPRRTWIDDGTLRDTARISDADVEGTSAEMLTIAAAIRVRGRYTAKRCAVDATVSDGVRLWSPRNSQVAALVTYTAADALGLAIETALGRAAPATECARCSGTPDPAALDPQLCTSCDRAVSRAALDELARSRVALIERADASERAQERLGVALCDLVAALPQCERCVARPATHLIGARCDRVCGGCATAYDARMAGAGDVRRARTMPLAAALDAALAALPREE